MFFPGIKIDSYLFFSEWPKFDKNMQRIYKDDLQNKKMVIR